MTDLSIEQKGLIDWLVNKFFGFVQKFKIDQNITKYVDAQYREGLEGQELTFNMNFVPKEGRVSILQDYVKNNVDHAKDKVGDMLRAELTRGLLNGESVPELKKRVKEVFKDNAFENRLKTVLRTEGMRANNMGALDGAIQSGAILKKWLDVTRDHVTSDICMKEYAEYGSKDKAIPIDEPFIVKVDGETISEMVPPFHPNCRSVPRFTRGEEA